MRKWLIALLFLLGCLCLVVYLRLGDDAAMEKKQPSWSLVYSGRSPLGALGAYKDGFAACNGKGDLIVFSTGKEPMTYKISEYSFSAPPLEKDGVVYVGDENGIFHAFSPERGELWSYSAVPSSSKGWSGSVPMIIRSTPSRWKTAKFCIAWTVARKSMPRLFFMNRIARCFWAVAMVSYVVSTFKMEL